VRLETAALLLAVFIAGGLGGAALERRSHVSEVATTPAPFMGRSDLRGTIPGYYEALDLTPEQRERIQSILDAARPETDSLLRTALPRLRELTRATREAIGEVLTDEQRAELEERFRRDRDRRRGSSRGRDGDRGDSGPPETGDRPR